MGKLFYAVTTFVCGFLFLASQCAEFGFKPFAPTTIDMLKIVTGLLLNGTDFACSLQKGRESQPLDAFQMKLNMDVVNVAVISTMDPKHINYKSYCSVSRGGHGYAETSFAKYVELLKAKWITESRQLAKVYAEEQKTMCSANGTIMFSAIVSEYNVHKKASNKMNKLTDQGYRAFIAKAHEVLQYAYAYAREGALKSNAPAECIMPTDVLSQCTGTLSPYLTQGLLKKVRVMQLSLVDDKNEEMVYSKIFHITMDYLMTGDATYLTQLYELLSCEAKIDGLYQKFLDGKPLYFPLAGYLTSHPAQQEKGAFASPLMLSKVLDPLPAYKVPSKIKSKKYGEWTATKIEYDLPKLSKLYEAEKAEKAPAAYAPMYEEDYGIFTTKDWFATYLQENVIYKKGTKEFYLRPGILCDFMTEALNEIMEDDICVHYLTTRQSLKPKHFRDFLSVTKTFAEFCEYQYIREKKPAFIRDKYEKVTADYCWKLKMLTGTMLGYS